MKKIISKIIFLFIAFSLMSCFRKPLVFQRESKQVYYARDMNGYKFITTGEKGTITLMTIDGQFVDEYYVDQNQEVYYFKAPDSGAYYADVFYSGRRFKIKLFF